MSVLPYSRQYLDDDDIESVVRALRSDFLTQGPRIAEFEDAVAQKVGAKYAVAVSSGTAALHLCYLAIGLSTGDELITTPNTFVATANAALYCGATPIFTDISAETGLINPALIEELITPNTKAIAPVDFAGCPSDMETIWTIAKRHNLKVIQDASHSLGATYKHTTVGDCAYADMTVFSFHPVKPMTTGEGGLITTNDVTLYHILLRLRTHGITKEGLQHSPGPWYYEMTDLGYNYRITDIQAALGLSQLGKLDRFIAARRHIANRYDAAFRDLTRITPLKEAAECQSGYHLYVVRIPFAQLGHTRADVMATLKAQGVGSQVHYIPVYHQPYYRTRFPSQAPLPGMEAYYQSALSLPIFPTMTDSDTDRVIHAIRSLDQGD